MDVSNNLQFLSVYVTCNAKGLTFHNIFHVVLIYSDICKQLTCFYYSGINLESCKHEITHNKVTLHCMCKHFKWSLRFWYKLFLLTVFWVSLSCVIIRWIACTLQGVIEVYNGKLNNYLIITILDRPAVLGWLNIGFIIRILALCNKQSQGHSIYYKHNRF